MAVVTIRYWASARAAAGTDRDVVEAASVREALASVRRRHGAEYGRVLDGCSVLRDGRPVDATDDARLDGYVELEALPPFAALPDEAAPAT